MIEYACGPYVSYQNLIIINFVPALLFLPAFSFIPESPYFSLRKGLANKAFESLSWLRTSQTLEAVESEMNEIKVSLMIAENYVTFICIYVPCLQKHLLKNFIYFFKYSTYLTSAIKLFSFSPLAYSNIQSTLFNGGRKIKF